MEVKILGYTFYPKKGEMGMRVHPNSIKKLKEKLKSITGRSNSILKNYDSCGKRYDSCGKRSLRVKVVIIILRN